MAEELSELLSLSVKHLYRLAKSGRMPNYRIGGAVRFDPQAVADWLEGKSCAI
jgi:excisionase family DNA binding protein